MVVARGHRAQARRATRQLAGAEPAVEQTALSACSEAVISSQPSAKRICWRDATSGRTRGGSARAVRVAFDSRPASDPDGVGRYSRCLLRALRETRRQSDELLETRARRPPCARARRRVPLAVDGRRDAAQPLPDGRHDPRPRRAEAPQRAPAHRPAPAPAPPGGAARRGRDRADARRSPRTRCRTCASSASA